MTMTPKRKRIRGESERQHHVGLPVQLQCEHGFYGLHPLLESFFEVVA